GIGANPPIFPFPNSLIPRSLPVAAPHELALLNMTSPRSSWSNPIWEQVRNRQHELFNGAMAWSATRFNLAQGGQTELVDGLWASGGYFDVLGVKPLLGRTFSADDDR